MFKVSLFEINHLFIFNNSFFIIESKILNHNHQNKKVVSSANIGKITY